jgi:hypothetical protein
VPPARPARSRIALGFVTAFVLLLMVSGLALLVGADDAAGRAFGAFQVLAGAVILLALAPVWRGPRRPGPGGSPGPGEPTPPEPGGPPAPGDPPGPERE